MAVPIILELRQDKRTGRAWVRAGWIADGDSSRTVLLETEHDVFFEVGRQELNVNDKGLIDLGRGVLVSPWEEVNGDWQLRTDLTREQMFRDTAESVDTQIFKALWAVEPRVQAHLDAGRRGSKVSEDTEQVREIPTEDLADTRTRVEGGEVPDVRTAPNPRQRSR